MAPPPSSAQATATARRATAAPQPRPGSRRPPLRVFQPEPRRAIRRGLSRRGHVWLAVTLVVGSLLVVVVGDAMVAQGQVRMAGLQSQIAAQVATQKAMQTDVANLAAPDRVVARAIALGSVAPGSVVDLPQVPLNVPLPVPDTAPVGTPVTTHATSPATTPATSSSTTAAASAGTSSSTAPTAR